MIELYKGHEVWDNQYYPDGHDAWQYISDHFLHVCKNKSVLEIGPFDGWISERILDHDPCSLTLIEAREESANLLRSKFLRTKSCNVLLGDMHYDLNQVGPIDVVIAMGIIYHSHAPLLFLEEMVNNCNPETILLDNPGQILNWHEEEVNYRGMRHTTNNKKTCGIVITISEEVILTAMKNLGYRLHGKYVLPPNLSLKQSVPVYHFERNNE